jgi:opacity protein-like surface antigen
MRNLLAAAFVGITSVLAALPASAQQVPEPRGYVGGGIGISSYRDYCDGIPAGFSCDDDGFAWRLQAGYMFMPWLGLEGSYINFGEAHAPGFLLNPPAGTTPLPSASDARTEAYVLSLLLRAPIGPVGLFAKVGYGAVTAKFAGNAAVVNNTTGAVTYFNSQARESKGQWVYGVGASFNITSQWHARFDWDRTEAQDNINPKYDVDAYTIGFGYRF